MLWEVWLSDWGEGWKGIIRESGHMDKLRALATKVSKVVELQLTSPKLSPESRTVNPRWQQGG